MGTFANSEGPDEMQHNAAFYQGLHCQSKKRSSVIKKLYLKNYNLTPLDIYNGSSKFIVSKEKEESTSIPGLLINVHN